MRPLILYEYENTAEVKPASANNMGTHDADFRDMALAWRVINLSTGEVLKDRFEGMTGETLPKEEIEELRRLHMHTTAVSPWSTKTTVTKTNHFDDEDLFTC
jgi:hypothetical protein